MPLSGLDSASVPGAPDAYWTVHQRFGSLPWAPLRAGHPLRRGRAGRLPRLHRTISGSRAKLGRFASSSAVYFPGGEPPAVGSLYRRPAYGRSSAPPGGGGPDAYYRGPIAAEMVRYAQEHGGLFSAEDFAAHRTEVYEPLRTTYRGVEVCETAPPSQGLLVLEMLNILEGFDLAGAGFGTPETMHLMVEAKKLAFADRLRYAGDPRFVDVPLRRAPGQGLRRPPAGGDRPPAGAGNVAGALPETLHGDTTSFVVADGQGNAVSFIHSLSAGFGSGVVAGETGITLNNRAGRGFTLEEGHPNVIAGGKRTMHTLNCYLLLREGPSTPWGALRGGHAAAVERAGDHQPGGLRHGPPGGGGGPPLVRLPRHRPGARREAPGGAPGVALRPRPGGGPGRRGHQVADLGPWSGGACQLILRQPAPVTGGPDGAPSGAVLVAGADPRPGAEWPWALSALEVPGRVPGPEAAGGAGAGTNPRPGALSFRRAHREALD